MDELAIVTDPLVKLIWHEIICIIISLSDSHPIELWYVLLAHYLIGYIPNHQTCTQLQINMLLHYNTIIISVEMNDISCYSLQKFFPQFKISSDSYSIHE